MPFCGYRSHALPFTERTVVRWGDDFFYCRLPEGLTLGPRETLWRWPCGGTFPVLPRIWPVGNGTITIAPASSKRGGVL